jgi:phosphoglycerate kinase
MAQDIRSMKDLELGGRRVFIRVDLNTPLSEGRVADDTRIRAVLPTIKHALEKEARVALASHLGRPKGKAKPELSLEPVGTRLAEILGCEVLLTDDCVGDGARKVVNDLREGQLALLENLRFHAGEQENDEGFARELAALADVYVNDAFGAAHRAHASVSALPRMMKSKGIGLLMEKEVSALNRIRANAPHPFVAVLGGAKVSDKIGVMETFLGRVDALLIGGAMANTFLAARGLSLGKSKIEPDKLALARSLIERAQNRDVQLLLPEDLVVAESPDAGSGSVVDADRVPEQSMALDVGPRTLKLFKEKILRANAVFWNGPLGMFEREPFAAGTMEIARHISDCAGFTVVGGGDSLAAVNRARLADRFDHVSTGGGASMEFLEGRQMPGLEAMKS